MRVHAHPAEEQAARPVRAPPRTRAPDPHTTAPAPPGPRTLPGAGQSAAAGSTRVSALVLAPGQIAADRAGQGTPGGVPAALPPSRSAPRPTQQHPGGLARGAPGDGRSTRSPGHHRDPPGRTGRQGGPRGPPVPVSLPRCRQRRPHGPHARGRPCSPPRRSRHLREFGDGSTGQARRSLNFACACAETMFRLRGGRPGRERRHHRGVRHLRVENLEVDIANHP
ncbi:hypothetical protein QJS66_09190 [Kocuria rhizophila]|nr:hypothetical protein QJS66_09190 [Kocuria rhizophila]